MTQPARGGEIVDELTFKLDGTFEGERVTLGNAPLDTVAQALEAFKIFIRETSQGHPGVAIGFSSGSIGLRPQLPIDSVAVIRAAVEKQEHPQNDPYAMLLSNLSKAVRRSNSDLHFAVMDGERELARINSNGPLLNIIEERWLGTNTTIFGQLIDLGGKSPNIHVETEEYGTLRIDASKEQIRSLQAYTYYNFSVECEMSRRDHSVIRNCKLRSFIRSNGEMSIHEAMRLEGPKWRDVGDIVEWVRSVRGEQ